MLIYLYVQGKLRFNFRLRRRKPAPKKLVPGPNQKVVKKMVKKVVRRVVVYDPNLDEFVEEISQNNEQITQSEVISEKEEDNE
jgi:hypothetical protein